jgi:hypothetical protein
VEADEVPVLLSAIRTFLVADGAFIELFCEVDPLRMLFAQVSSLKSELEAVFLLNVIVNDPGDGARYLAENGAIAWIEHRLEGRLSLEYRSTKKVKYLIGLASDLFFRVPNCCDDVVKMTIVVFGFFEGSKVRVKEAVLAWMMVVAYVAADSDFQRVVLYLLPLLAFPSQIAQVDLGIYFDAVHRILAAMPISENPSLFEAAVADGELPEFLERIAADPRDPDLAGKAAILSEMLTADPRD